MDLVSAREMVMLMDIRIQRTIMDTLLHRGYTSQQTAQWLDIIQSN